MINTLYLPELRELLALDDVEGLREFCTALHPGRTAEFMEGLTAAEAWSVLRAAELSPRIEIFCYLPKEVQLEILETTDPAELSELVAEMPPDDRVDLLRFVSDDRVEALLPLLPAAERRDIHRLSQYPEGTAGSVMTTEVARLPETLTVRQALDELAQQAEGLETVYYVYIVDDANHLRGLVSARQLVTSLGKPNTRLADLMERDLVTVEATDDREAVAAKVAEFDFLAIPVVDHEQHLVGIITHDDVIDVLRLEAEEDAYLAVAINPLEQTYLSTPWYTLSWKRGVWLFVLSIAALMTVLLLERYRDRLDRVEWLAWFIPLIISCGGNSGAQSATLVITALTSGDLALRDWWKVIRRELIMGLCLGTFLGIVGYVFAYFLIDGPAEGGPTSVEKLVIPITLLLVVLTGTLCGGVLPLVFRRMGLDPALMSNPFVAGIVDIAGIIIYMAMAVLMLKELRTITGG